MNILEYSALSELLGHNIYCLLLIEFNIVFHQTRFLSQYAPWEQLEG